MITAIATVLAKVGIGTIADKIAAAYVAAETAKSDRERIAAEERIKLLEAKRAVMVAEAPYRFTAWMRGFLAAPVGILLWKVLVWDKALGEWTGGRTDALSPELWQVVGWVMGFYFLAEGASSVARIFRGR